MSLAVRIIEDGEELWDEIDGDAIVVEPGDDDTVLVSPAPYEAVEDRVLARHGLTRTQVEFDRP